MNSDDSTIGEQVTKASVNLVAGGAISLAIQGITSILLARMLLPESYGIYSMVLVLVGLLLPFRNLGVPASVQYHSARCSHNDSLCISRVAMTGAALEFCTGITISVIIVPLSHLVVAATGFPELLPVIASSIPILLFSGVYQSTYSLFLGTMESRKATILLVFFSTVKGTLSVLLVIQGYGAIGAILGYALASLFGALLAGLFIVRARMGSSLHASSIHFSTSRQVRSLLGYGLLVGLSEAMATVTTLASMIVGMFFISASAFGVYSVANTLYLFLSGLFYPLVQVLLSAYAKLERGTDALEQAYKSSTQITALLAGTTSVVAAVLSTAVVPLLFGSEYSDAGYLFALMCLLNAVIMPLGGLTNGSLMLARGYNREYSIVYLVAMAVSIPGALLLVPILGPLGMVLIAFLSLGIPVIGCGFYIQNKLCIRFVDRKTLKMIGVYLFSIAIGLVTFQLSSGLQSVLSCILTAGITVAIILVGLTACGALSVSDAEFIQTNLEGVPIISSIGRLFLALVHAFTSESR